MSKPTVVGGAAASTDAANAATSAPWARWIEELALVLGLCVGWWLVGRYLSAHHGTLGGTDWEVYVDSAAAWHDPGGLGVAPHDWRGMLHPFLVSTIGETFGYVHASAWISAGAGVVVVASAGLLGRALAGGVAGGIAACIAGAWPPLLHASVALNSYPLQAAMVGAAFALAAAACRWPGVTLATLAGLAAAAAALTDPRGIVAAPVVGLLVLAGAAARGRWRAAGMVLGAGLAFGAVDWAGTDLAARHGLVTRPLSDLAARQYDAQGTAPGRAEGGIEAACRDRPSGLSILTSPCGAAMRAANVRELSRHKILPSAHLLWLGALFLIPARWGVRSVPATLAVFGVASGGATLAFSVVMQDERYLVWLAVPLAAWLPVATARAGELARRWVPPWLFGGVAALALARLVVELPLAPKPQPPDARIALAEWLREAVGPAESIVDCGDATILELSLPARPRLKRAPSNSANCPELARAAPTERQWLVSFAPPRSRAEMDAAIMAGGWSPVPCGARGPPCSMYRVWTRGP